MEGTIGQVLKQTRFVVFFCSLLYFRERNLLESPWDTFVDVDKSIMTYIIYDCNLHSCGNHELPSSFWRILT